MNQETELEERLSRPNEADLEALRKCDGDVMVLGAAGKMGPSLARRLQRAAREVVPARRVWAVSRFSDAKAKVELEDAGIECIRCNLLSRSEVDQLSQCPNVFYLAGRKFGTSGQSELTWASNTVAPANVSERFRDSRLVCFSTGNVYPFRTHGQGGCRELDPVEPRGDYAYSSLGRERVFEYFSRTHGTPCVLFRLNYAVDLRYGVIVDIARKVYEGLAVSLNVPYFNIIWQGDANSYAIRSLSLATSPPRVLNVTGAKVLSVRETAQWFGNRWKKPVTFCDAEGTKSLLSDASLCHQLLGPPEVDELQLSEMVAQWIEGGGVGLGRPTKFEVTDGKF